MRSSTQRRGSHRKAIVKSPKMTRVKQFNQTNQQYNLYKKRRNRETLINKLTPTNDNTDLRAPNKFMQM